jgi:hypothetical protein
MRDETNINIGSLSDIHDSQVNIAGGDINIFQRFINYIVGDIEQQRALRNRQMPGREDYTLPPGITETLKVMKTLKG